jgi:exodeoxyribonuclease-3
MWILGYSSTKLLFMTAVKGTFSGRIAGMTVKVASWNVNSIKIRVEAVTSWLREAQPDVLCLQELKCEDGAFPRGAIEDLGYNLAIFGQKTYNGVAIVSKWPLSDIRRGLPGMPDDEQSRYIEAVVEADGGVFRVASIYLPNGNPVDSPKFPYKLDWMAALKSHAEDLLRYEEPLVLAGDYNVIPMPEDVYDPNAWVGDALYRPESRAALRSLYNLGLTDAIRACHDEAGLYTFWDYQAGAWQRNKGIRIDHLLLSPEAASRLHGAGIDKHVRGYEKPSDHVPVWAVLS